MSDYVQHFQHHLEMLTISHLKNHDINLFVKDHGKELYTILKYVTNKID